MTTITDGVETVTPILWMQYKSTRDARTVTHPLASGTSAYTVYPAGPRTVTLALLFNDEDESIRCEEMHARTGILAITEEGRDTASMEYVVTGAVARELDTETADVWIVSAEVEEVGT